MKKTHSFKNLIMVSFSTIVALFLGFFEFFLVFKSEVLGDFSSLEQLKLFPASFSNDPASHFLLCAFTMFLGLLRVSWAVSGHTVLSWLCVVFTHVIETVFLWNLALLPHWNTKGLTLIDLIPSIIRKEYDVPSSVLLFLVPGFALFFLLCGPNTPSKKHKTS